MPVTPLRFRQNNRPTPSGDYQPSRSLSMAGSERGVTLSTALRLAKFFGVSADFLLSIQMRCDLYRARAIEKIELDSIQDFSHLQKWLEQAFMSDS